MTSFSNQHHQQSAGMPTENGPPKDHLTLNVGEDFRFCHFNIERIFKAKCEILTKTMNKERVGLIALQGTHTQRMTMINEKKGYIAGYVLI